MNAPTVTFLLPVRSQPRFHKRIQMLMRAGLSVRVATVDRDYIEGEEFDYPIASLGRAYAGRYWLRALMAPRIVAAMRKLPPSDVVYAFGTEMALYARIAGVSDRLIVEIGDIRGVLTRKGFVPSVVRAVDRFILSRADRVVATSPHYLADYYKRRQELHLESGLVIENKIDRGTAVDLDARRLRRPPRGSRGSKRLRIGWFGLLRDRRTWNVLRQWAAGDPEHREVRVRGYSTAQGPTRTDLETASGVRFGGEYRWPTELAEMYDKVDLVCAAYPTGSPSVGNWMWARTNRFYEAGFFRKPMLVAEGGADAVPVHTYGIGQAIDFFDSRRAVEQLDALDPEIVRSWTRAFEAVPRELFVETNEGEQLASEILSLLDWGETPVGVSRGPDDVGHLS